MDNVQHILGTKMVGGGPPFRKPKKANKSKPHDAIRKKSKNVKPVLRSRCLDNTPLGGSGVHAHMMMAQQQIQSEPVSGGFEELKHSVQILGGDKKVKKNVKKNGEMSRSEYKKYLNNLTVKRLYAIAKNKGVYIYTKKNGKVVAVHKAIIVKKLCELKHGK